MEAGFGTGRARLEILSGHDILKAGAPSDFVALISGVQHAFNLLIGSLTASP